MDELKSELGGHFEDIILGLMMTRAEFDAFCVKTAVKGLGTDEKALIEVLCSRTNEEMTAAKDAYKKSQCMLQNSVVSENLIEHTQEVYGLCVP